jgi:quinoprotein glucose dehydrogenase
MTGHLAYQATIDLDLKIYPGMNEQHSLISRQFFRCKPDQPYVRHDLRVWENAGGRGPQLRDSAGGVLWATRSSPTGASGRRAERRECAGTTTCIPTVITPDARSRTSKNKFGDPLPVIQHRPEPATLGRAAATRQHFADLFAQLAKANDGRLGKSAD